ncbi:MAG: 5-formyltetrahydrofolate cyclo-ligase [Flavobacteriales bacterium CG_4_9_14_3_um_filter_40_17]|nr:MAG: 5-formyltetrahydrofolate cyclo-ligase [Flavobacteriales bacterium CG_4_9_14_3_um_filter_40_17]
MDKNNLRNLYKNKRSALTATQVSKLSLKLFLQTEKLPIWDWMNFHVFLSIEKQKEPLTQPLIDLLLQKNKTVILSKTNHQTGTLSHFRLTPDTQIITNTYGIPEPISDFQINENEIDVVFVPLLTFDESGNRVGYGKGFYDRFLSKCCPDVVKIGWSFFEAEKKIDDVLPTDIRLDFCVTPERIYNF